MFIVLLQQAARESIDCTSFLTMYRHEKCKFNNTLFHQQFTGTIPMLFVVYTEEKTHLQIQTK